MSDSNDVTDSEKWGKRMAGTTIENAKITATRLGDEGHGIFSASVCLEGDGWGVWFGGYALDTFDKPQNRRVGTAFGMEFISGVLRAVGVKTWEALVGQHVRVENTGLGGKALRIGHITKNEWFDPEALAEAHRGKP